MARNRTYPVRPDVIERLRQSRALSMEELASEAGISLRQLKRILNGTKSYLATIQLLAEALNTSPDSLRADIDASVPATKTRFSYDLSIEGSVDDDGHFNPLVQLTPSIIALLTARGIKVSGHEAHLSIAEYAGGDAYRELTWFTFDIDGKTCWWFVAVKPDKLEQLDRNTQNSGEPLLDFDPYGEILSVGWGQSPDDAAALEVAEIFGIKKEAFLEWVHSR